MNIIFEQDVTDPDEIIISEPEDIQSNVVSSDCQSEWTAEDIAELSLGEKCAALGAFVACADKNIIDSVTILILDMLEELNDLGLYDFYMLPHYTDHPIPVQLLLNAFVKDSERAVAFALCEIVASVEESTSDSVISRLVTIVQSWGWTVDKASRMVEDLKYTQPDFFHNICHRLFE